MSAVKPTDPFAAVLGAGRGKLPVDTVLSPRPTDAAREDLDVYLQQLGAGDFEPTLQLLGREHALIERRPLLSKLGLEFCRYLVGTSAVRFDDSVRVMLDETAVYPKLADHLVLSYTPRQRGRPEQRKLHVWPQGHLVGPLGCITEQTATVCGLEVTRHWQRAQRGNWSSDAASELGWSRCQDCEEGCPDELRWVLEESSAYIPFGAPLYARMLKTVRKRAMKGIAERSVQSLNDAQVLCDSTYRACLLPAAVTYATSSGEAVLQRVLEVRSWHSVKRAHQGAMTELLDTEDWRTALEGCMPRAADDGEVMFDVSRCQTARGELAALVRERVGLPPL